MSTTAKLFRNGRSQAVRLPKEFRFDGTEVRIRRSGQGVLLEPVTPIEGTDWSWLDAARARLSPDFFEGLGEQPEPQARPELDELFP